jgi:DNA polymerase-3 subunit delta'
VPCRKIAEGNHADLIEILPKGENIPVDSLREMKKTLFFSPLEGRLRFVIIDEAHKLGAAAANTLLKTLEEPPAHTRFFLITHERGLLLPTIVSRCQFVHFAPLPRDTLAELLEAQGVQLPARLREACLDLMGGGLGRAELFSNESVLEFISAMAAELESPAQGWAQAVRLADQLATPASAGEDWKLELLLDLMVRRAHGLSSGARAPGARMVAASQGLKAAYFRRRLTRYANRKLVALAAAELALGGESTA